MGNLEIFQAKVAQVWTPSPPPPPPPDAPQEFHAHTLETYQPDAPKADRTQYSNLASSPGASRGTQPLNLPDDWMDKLPPPAVDLSSAGSGRVSRSLVHSTPLPVADEPTQSQAGASPAPDSHTIQAFTPGLKYVTPDPVAPTPTKAPTPVAPATPTKATTPAAPAAPAAPATGGAGNLLSSLLGGSGGAGNLLTSLLGGSGLASIIGSVFNSAGGLEGASKGLESVTGYLDSLMTGKGLSGSEQAEAGKMVSNVANGLASDPSQFATMADSALKAMIGAAGLQATVAPDKEISSVSNSEFAQYEIKDSTNDALQRMKDNLTPGSSWVQMMNDLLGSKKVQETKLTDAQLQQMREIMDTATRGASPEDAETVAFDLWMFAEQDRVDPAQGGGPTLLAQDASGKSILDHLSELVHAPELAGPFAQEDRGALLRTLIDHLQFTGKINQGVDTLDCALATLEANYADHRPIDFVRNMVDLATQGETNLVGIPGEGPAKLDLSNFDPAKQAGRSTFDYAFQSALRGYVGETGDRGLDAKEVDTLMDTMFGSKFTSLSGSAILPGIMQVITNPDFLQEATFGHGSPGKVTMRDGDVLHSMSIARLKADGVQLWDPETNKVYKLPLDVFMNHVERIELPTQYLGGMGGSAADAREGGGRTATTSRKG